MSMSSTCVLMYAMPSLQRCMPCILLISVVTSTSMQTRLRDVSDFRDLVISQSVAAVILLLLMCASYGHELYMYFVVCHAILTEVYAMYFCDLCGD